MGFLNGKVKELYFKYLAAAFLRNDRVLSGGIFNVFGDYIFVFVLDMGILTILFNRQIVRYLGVNALSVYGVIVTVSTFVQCCAYSVGRDSQPVISVNFGAKRGNRIRETLKIAPALIRWYGLSFMLLPFNIPMNHVP